MKTVYYWSISCACALASLGACSRASYQLAAPAAYLPAPAVVPPPPLAAPTEAPRWVGSAPVLRALPRPHRQAPPPTLAKLALCRPQEPALTKPLRGRPAPARPAAGAGPYFSGINFGAFLVLAALSALLITALASLLIALLVRLLLHFIHSRARRHAATPVPTP